MSDVWLAIPSARPVEQADPILDLWRKQGYKIALWRDDEKAANPLADVLMFPGPGEKYPGYAQACNELVRFIIDHDPAADWVVCAGDDTEPDLNHTAQEIARECERHFACRHGRPTFGVMQPTGDRWGADEPWAQKAFPDRPAYIDRICGSSWFGREFCRRIYQGKGLWWPEYYHMYADEEMYEVAIKLGVLWQRRDLIHLHKHWGRNAGKENMPQFLARANSPEQWRESKALFESRKAAGFPGHEPL